MNWLFGTKAQASADSKFSGLSVQTSVYGKCIPIVFGATRIAANLIWYGDFVATPHIQNNGGGGKGGLFGGGSGSNSVTYTYSAAVAMGVCEGPITGYGTVFADKALTTTAALNLYEFLGTYPQTPWAYLTTNHPSSAFPYNGVAYVASPNYDLGGSAQLPNHNFEVKGLRYGTLAGTPDADPSLIVTDLLTNPKFGLPNFSWLGDLTNYQNYLYATRLFLSPAYEQQTPLRTILDEIALATNSECLFSNANFRLIPRGDAQISGNGKVYLPPAVEYDLTDDDFLPTSGASGAGGSSIASPILITRKRISDCYNSIQFECLDRNNYYNKSIVEAKDQASIDLYGLRQDKSHPMHIIADTAIAQLSAQLYLQKQTIQNQYYWSTDLRYLLLEPMDWVTLTHSNQQLNRVLVRITKIERKGNTLLFTAEEVLDGIATAALYNFSTGQGFAADYNASAGNCQAPFMFEPTDELAGALEIWLATSGGATWGGCQVWVANDPNGPYELIGTQYGRARYGTLIAGLPSIAANVSGQTIDQTNTLAVDIGTTGQLLNGSDSDATSLNTLCYVDGEYIAYADSALYAGTGKYNLNYLVRGALGTSIGSHALGSKFARLDKAIFKIPYTQDRVGQTIYVKLLSFNNYGAALQSLADVSPYSYKISGLALTSPLPNVQNVREVFESGFTKIWWDEVIDFRNGVRYEIRRGDSYVSSQQLATQAHPPFIAFGTGTYWITAYCQPVAGLFVYSETPTSIVISGNMIVSNLVITSDQGANNWPGKFDNTGLEGTVGHYILRLVGQENILTEPSFLTLPDVLNAGGIVPSGHYEVPDSDILDVGYVAQCQVNASWKATGAPVGDNILVLPDVLNSPDILGSASTRYVDAWVEIATSQSGPGDLYLSPDLYQEGNLYTALIPWSSWQRFVPGVYVARLIKLRLVLETIDSKTICYVLTFAFDVSVPPRIDHYPDFDVPSAGVTVIFEPDNASTPAPFNGGPNVGGSDHNQPLPYYNISAPNAAGLTPIIDSLSLASITFHWEDASHSRVHVPHTSLIAEGY